MVIYLVTPPPPLCSCALTLIFSKLKAKCVYLLLIRQAKRLNTLRASS